MHAFLYFLLSLPPAYRTKVLKCHFNLLSPTFVMRGSAWLVLTLTSGTVVLASAIPPNHAPTHRTNPRFRPSQRDYQPSSLPPSSTTSTTPTPDLEMTDVVTPKRRSPAVTKLRQLLTAKSIDHNTQATQVHEDKVEAAGGHHLHPHSHLVPLAHVLPQLTLLLQLLQNLLHHVVPPPHIPHHYHHSGHHLHPHAGHGPGHGLHGAYSHQGGLLHPKPLGPFYGPGLYGVSAGNNVLGKGPFPAYKYEDNAKKK